MTRPIPLYMHDDDEGPDQAGLSNALGLKFTDSGSTGPGWWSVALADPRYSTTPIILDPATSRTYTLAEIVSLFPPPAIGDPSGFWSAASNQPFSRWLWSLTSAIAATTQHFGPNYGFRSTFPCMTFSEYALSRTGGGPPQDLHLANFGGTNNYSFLRLSTAFPFALPWTAPTHSQSGCSALASPRLPHESIPSFYAEPKRDTGLLGKDKKTKVDSAAWAEWKMTVNRVVVTIPLYAQLVGDVPQNLWEWLNKGADEATRKAVRDAARISEGAVDTADLLNSDDFAAVQEPPSFDDDAPTSRRRITPRSRGGR
jgi:hypothetical protein